jgi:hypothetical protein
MCHRRQPPPFIAKPIHAGRPACFADGSTDHPGAPKGIRNLTWGFRAGSAGLDECRSVAGQGRCLSPVCAARSRRVSGGFRAFPWYKAREWHAAASSQAPMGAGHMVVRDGRLRDGTASVELALIAAAACCEKVVTWTSRSACWLDRRRSRATSGGVGRTSQARHCTGRCCRASPPPRGRRAGG